MGYTSSSHNHMLDHSIYGLTGETLSNFNNASPEMLSTHETNRVKKKSLSGTNTKVYFFVQHMSLPRHANINDGVKRALTATGIP